MKGTKGASSNKLWDLHIDFDDFSRLKDAVLGSSISPFDAPIQLRLGFLADNQFSLEGTALASQPEVLDIVEAPRAALSLSARSRVLYHSIHP
jgi:hypothetical protein